MNDAEAVRLLSRWVTELRCDLQTANQQITQLQSRVADFSYWMNTGLSPDQIRVMADTLDTATL